MKNNIFKETKVFWPLSTSINIVWVVMVITCQIVKYEYLPLFPGIFCTADMLIIRTDSDQKELLRGSHLVNFPAKALICFGSLQNTKEKKAG